MVDLDARQKEFLRLLWQGGRMSRWELHRRTVREESAVFRTFDEMFPRTPGDKPRNPHLFSVFLSAGSRVKTNRASLGFAIDLGVLVPEYEVDGFLWRDQHYAGSYLFRDTVTIEATPHTDDQGKTTFAIKYGFDKKTPNRAPTKADVQNVDGGHVCKIPLSSGSNPGLKGSLVLRATPWN